MILLDLLGPYPLFLGWLWYLFIVSSSLLVSLTHIALNITRVFLIKRVRPVLLFKINKLVWCFSAC